VPTADEHRAQAAENLAFYNEIGGVASARKDWALTILFYAAVHEVAAFLADQKGAVIGMGQKWPVTGHPDRITVLTKKVFWNRLATYYRNFYDWSRRTRYDCEIPDEERVRKMEDLLQRIKDEIAAL
jgi:hypothetical protein